MVMRTEKSRCFKYYKSLDQRAHLNQYVLQRISARLLHKPHTLSADSSPHVPVPETSPPPAPRASAVSYSAASDIAARLPAAGYLLPFARVPSGAAYLPAQSRYYPAGRCEALWVGG